MIVQSMKMAVKSILSNKMRSFLTMLGIIIGVVALVVLVSLVNGATGSITDTIDALGSDMLTVTIRDDYNKPIKMADLDAFEEEDTISLTAPVTQTTVTAVSSYAQESVTLIGTIGNLATIKGIEIDSGRFLLSPDEENHTNVAVINTDMATEVLGRTDVVGETVKLNGREFLIIGVYSENSSVSGQSSDNYTAYIPYSSYIRMNEGASSGIQTFYVSAPDNQTDAAEEAITRLLLDRFQQDEDAFSIMNQSAIAEAMSDVTGTLSLMLGGIAAISLLVGGIGIMNIMLVSVTERTREIGIRKAIGAGRGTIMLQFLIEALMVSLIGCMIGIGLSWVILWIINLIGGVDYGLSAGVTLLSILFSLGIGIVFGLYPANKAAKMKPIDALRYQ